MVAWRRETNRLLRRGVVEAERLWDERRVSLRPGAARRPRFEAYVGHGAGERVVLRARLLDGGESSAATDGEGTWAAVRRTAGSFVTIELPDVPVVVTVGDVVVETVTDAEGYVELEVEHALTPADGPWVRAAIATAAGDAEATLWVRVPEAGAAYGVISDVDDTILVTGAQRAAEMVRVTLAGSALTRTAFRGAPELYRALAGSDEPGPERPVFYVSSSPWNLHGFLEAFLEHRGFPLGPLLLRDALGSGARRTHRDGKLTHIAEVLALHPDLSFVLIGDSGQHDPEIYAEVVRTYPGRIRAVYVREVRLDPGDGRVEAVRDGWDQDVPLVLAADSDAVAEHAVSIGLIPGPLPGPPNEP